MKEQNLCWFEMSAALSRRRFGGVPGLDVIGLWSKIWFHGKWGEGWASTSFCCIRVFISVSARVKNLPGQVYMCGCSLGLDNMGFFFPLLNFIYLLCVQEQITLLNSNPPSAHTQTKINTQWCLFGVYEKAD